MIFGNRKAKEFLIEIRFFFVEKKFSFLQGEDFSCLCASMTQSGFNFFFGFFKNLFIPSFNN